MESMMNKQSPGVLAGPPFAVAIGLGAFLLFLVQFIMGKLILPWFGGAAAVWTTCMLFFQVGLLLGYGYAHLLTTYLPPRWQRDVHVLLLLLSLALLAVRAFIWPSPLLPDDSWKPSPGGSPSLQILLLLSLTVGLPYLVLSATGPLLQAWFARLRPGQKPYRLYALSNLGSLLGLLSYPFLLEPALPLPAQGRFWTLGFGLFAIGCSLCALPLGRLAPRPLPATQKEDPAAASPPPLSHYALWFTLAAVASVMLLAVTNQICQEVAVVPFLWMLPLCLYLFSFILCFEFERSYHRAVWGTALVLSAGASAATLHWGTDAPLPVQLGAHTFVLLAYCMVCHGELAVRKPPARYLTSFYLTLSAGGAAGGLFSALLAPAIFPAFWEFHCALLAGVILLGGLLWSERRDFLAGGRWPKLAAAALGMAALCGLGTVLVTEAMDDLGGAVYVSRNFFGVLRVSRRGQGADEFLRLKHGRTPHGMQYTEPQRRMLPTTFYNPGSGVGLALVNHPRQKDPQAGLRVGVVGLGAGTLAAYARPGDSYRFYEINPEVIRLSTSQQPLFTYLRDARGQVTTVLGDARLSMEHETPQEFDLLALDAFSSDAIPIHLLTREAVELYLRHLKHDGILAVHITNRYLDLRPVIRGIMEQTGLFAVLIDQDVDQDDLTSWYSRWVLLSREWQSLAAKEVVQPGVQLSFDGGRRVLWTDAHSDLWRVRRK
jgi:hypothetical protein